MNRRRLSTRWLGVGLIVLFILFWIPTPYVVIQPGSAEPVQSMVRIEAGYTKEEGSLMLTTVRMTYTNVAVYLMSLFNPYADIQKKSTVFREGESQEEYSQRQVIHMLGSQSNAVQAAYNKASVPYEIETQEV